MTKIFKLIKQIKQIRKEIDAEFKRTKKEIDNMTLEELREFKTQNEGYEQYYKSIKGGKTNNENYNE